MTKNVYLVGASDVLGPQNMILPLAMGYLWCHGKNDDCSLKDVLIEKQDPNAYAETMEDPFYCMMSSYVWNWEYNQQLALAVKKRHPDCVIITGGPQIDKADPNFFEKYSMFDIAVHGEGEDATREILSRDSDFDGIPQAQTRSHMPTLATRRRQVGDIPSPILEGFYEPIMAKYPEHTKWQLNWESLRGCPYHCAFCDIGDSYWNKLTLFDMQRCRDEIEWMGKNKIEYVSVCDSNWGLLERDVALTRCVLETKLKYGYPKFFDAAWAKNNVERNFEIAKMVKDSPVDLFKGVTFAMQSFNEPTLKATERFNIDDAMVAEYLKKYDEQGIPTYSELIWPMPEETYDSLRANIQRLIDLGQDSYLMIHPLVITFNATMGSKGYQHKWGLTVKKIPLDTFYMTQSGMDNHIPEYTDAVYSTRTAGWDDVLRGFMFGWVAILMYYYGWGHFLAKYLNKQGVKQCDFFEHLREWIIRNPNTLLHNEYLETEQHYRQTYHHMKPWGRKVRSMIGKSDDIYWEYKSASSIVLHDNKTILAQELTRFLQDTYGYESAHARKVVDLNLAMTRDRETSYPRVVHTDKQIAMDMLGLDEDVIYIDHHDHTTPDNKWYQKAYHMERKNRYWKCTADTHSRIPNQSTKQQLNSCE
jgi:putative methyltransferase